MQAASRTVYVDPSLVTYAVKLVAATRDPRKAGLHNHARFIQYGASPRAALALAAASKARALMDRRLNASYEDVRAIAGAVLRHRLLLDYGAKLEGLTPDLIVVKLLENVPAQDKPLPSSLRAAKI